MKQQGEESVKHKPCIENKDLRCLKESALMSPSALQGLLNNVWFHITIYFCRRGRERQRNLKKSSFVFLQDENGNRYATMAHDEASKNHQGDLSDNTVSFEQLGKCTKQSIQTTDTMPVVFIWRSLILYAALSFNTRSVLGKDHKKECGLRIDILG